MASTDKELAARIAAGEERAMEEVVELYGGLIKAVVHKHLAAFEAYQEDCINDVLFAVWKNIRHYNPSKNSLKNWIGAISKYKSIDYKRKYYMELDRKEADETVAADGRVEDRLLRRELEEEAWSMLRFLKPRDRELFFKRYVLEEDMEELSKSFNERPEVLYNRLSRGRKKLRLSLERKGTNRYEK
ncbi:MAG TPA: sigma-70 family RNA polymerase sigma factor [Candidatus Avimonoglobus intestinipullorum]|uniref:Sigma-70 family RNA polymerase sigma factor n=1 Tax=Candidatus Avimonoglobus intestinipullorum TaxID=2840699 RepID=A0A9D1LTZ9_9FIRM|nr:sigma-70 family RNA polymerase sigma factor [Candidatus Avimonoglobus intestinipullorum]